MSKATTAVRLRASNSSARIKAQRSSFRETGIVPRLIAASLGAAVCGVCLCVGAQAPPPRHAACSLHAKITDEDGGPIRAFVLLRSKRGVAANQALPVDRNAELNTRLAAGFYDLFVSAPGFQPLAQVVDLRSCQPLSLNLTLFFNPDEHTDASK